MTVAAAYQLLYTIVLIAFSILAGIMLIRAIVGPLVTDRVLSINMIGTMVILMISILSVLLDESYLLDVALLYALISFVTVLVFAQVYIQHHREEKL